jgi:uncharacterized membrane protein
MMWIKLAALGIAGLIAWKLLSSDERHRREPTPEEILRRRYARGEIDEVELEQG